LIPNGFWDNLIFDAFLYRSDKSIASSLMDDTESKSGLEFTTEVQPGSLNANGNFEQNNIYKIEYRWRF